MVANLLRRRLSSYVARAYTGIDRPADCLLYRLCFFWLIERVLEHHSR